jgi:pimeloyl-ACP methyl ester carboxylesterase
VLPDWPEPQRSCVPSRGLSLSLCQWGDVTSARLVLVGAHGFLDCAEFFTPLVAALRRHHPDLAVAAFSFAGHGRSSWADAYGWYDHTADLTAVTRAVAARMSPRARLGLVGHSFGAVQVLQALTLDPALAAFAVNLDAVSPPVSVPDETLAGILAQVADQRRDLRPLPTYATLNEIVKRRAASNPRLPLPVLTALAPDLAREHDGRWSWRVDPALVGWVRPWNLTGAPPVDALDLTRRLPRSLPVLTVTGAAQDHPQVRGHYPGDAALATVPGRHYRLPDAGHYVHLERPDEVAAALLDFAAGQP